MTAKAKTATVASSPRKLRSSEKKTAEPTSKGVSKKASAETPKSPSKAKKAAVAAEASSSATQKKHLTVGDNLPADLVLQNEDDEDINLSELVQTTNVVLFFYPKANTPGCTKQACGFRDNIKTFHDKHFKVFGVSGDKPKSQKTWQTKQSLPYSLLSDVDGTLRKHLGVSKNGGASTIRSHVIIAKGGEIVESAIQVSPADSVAQATAFVEAH